ncbi:MAG: flagellar biosynthesis protein FlhA [Verrucomicrobiota bacterium]
MPPVAPTPTASNSAMTSLAQMLIKRGDILFSAGFLTIIFILVIPLPTFLIDLMLSLSIALSVLVILTISNLKEPTEFFAFPTILLFVTLFRLGLNIATTRSVLTIGEAGNLINTFAKFCVGDSIIVGLIIFLILTIINFVVITKGAGRVAEVAARFTLDAMPGKQMAIDADLNAGIISEQDARSRRKGLERESSFYGSMDGASKFVRGDAVAGLLITFINLVGGVGVGVLQLNLTVAESFHKFALLTIGDGLVTQIPSLLISAGAGILVTRSNSTTGLGEDIAGQILSNKKTVIGTGIVMFLMAFIPGFPMLILFALGLIFIGIGSALPDPAAVLAAETKAKKEGEGKKNEPRTDVTPKPVDPLGVELGLGLLPLVSGNVQNMLDRLSALRRALSSDLGITIPPISVKDNPTLAPHNYRVLLRGHEIAGGELFPGQLLAMGVGNMQRPLRGRVTTEPAFGLPATWIMETERREAERMGYAVVDPLSILVTHTNQTLKSISADLLSRQDVQKMIDQLKQSDPAVVQEMTVLQLSLGLIHRVLQNLLQEGLSVREFGIILEKLCDQIAFSKNPDELSEACRKVLVLEISRQLELRQNKLNAITLQPDIEQLLSKCIRQTAQEIALVMDPHLARHLHDQLQQGIQKMLLEGLTPVLLCSPLIRLGVKRFFAETFPSLKILAYNEISSKIPLHAIHTVGAPMGGH